MVAIDAAAGYVPLYRIARSEIAAQHGGSGRGESAVPSRDENHITMASEGNDGRPRAFGRRCRRYRGCFRCERQRLLRNMASSPRNSHTGSVCSDRQQNQGLPGTARAAADALETDSTCVLPRSRWSSPPQTSCRSNPGRRRGDNGEPAPGRSSFGHVATIQPRRSIRWDRQRLAFSSGTANTASPPNRGSPVRASSTRRPTGRDDGARTNRNRRRSRVCSRQCTGVSVRSNGASVHRRGTTLDVQRRRVRRHGDVVAGHRTRAGIDRSGDSLVAIAYGQGGADAFRLTVTDATDERPGLSVSDQIETKEYVPYMKHVNSRERYEYQGCRIHERTALPPDETAGSTTGRLRVSGFVVSFRSRTRNESVSGVVTHQRSFRTWISHRPGRSRRS